MPFQGERLVVKAAQKAELEEIARSLSLPAGFVLRAKIVLLLDAGLSYAAVAEKLDTTTPTVGKWKKRFLAQGLDGLETHRPGQAPKKLTPKLRARILNATRHKPKDGSTHWSCRQLAKQLARIAHQASRESARKVRQYETRDTWRAQAYLTVRRARQVSATK